MVASCLRQTSSGMNSLVSPSESHAEWNEV